MPSLIHLTPLLYIVFMKEDRYQNVFIEYIGICHHLVCVTNIITCMVCTIQQMTLKFCFGGHRLILKLFLHRSLQGYKLRGKIPKVIGLMQPVAVL